MFISNFKSRKTKNFLIGAISFFCFIIMCFCGFSLTISNTASQSILKAQSVGNFPYFKAKVGSIDFFNGQTVFLNSGQSLEITFGKPIGMPHEEATNIYLNQDNIGEHALSWLSGGFELKINGERVLNPELSEKYSIEKYYYNPGYVHGSESNPEGREFEYFTLSINLADTTLFPSGKYEITFNDFMEYSGIDYSFGNKKTFTAIFYLFNTLDYFSSESAINAKIEMKNTREVSKLDTIYKNYFYFNYTNQNPANDFNSLPYLSFEKNKFIIEISKSYQGITQSCTVSKFEPNYVRLGTNTNNNFVDVVSKPEEPDKLLIYFKDLGEYAINFKFIYSENESTYTLLTNNKIDNFKKDILHIFGYQLFYSDINDQKNNEFKDIQNGEYNLNNSSDVSYLLPYENLSNKYVANLADDNAIMQELNGETAVSTNQPIVSVKYNTNLEIVNSYYYLWDSETSDWKKQGDEYQKYPYSNTNFADAGKYLLKVIYSYNQNYDSNGNLASDVFFTQYFYFTITNVTATVSVREQITNFDTGEITEKSLSTNAYTQNPVRIILSGQSIFNSDVRVIIGSKDYIFTNYNTIETTLNSDAQEQSYIVSANKNYKITMYFGKNKTQTSFFTIDNSPFEDVRVVSVTKSVGSSKHYVKGNEISFFTSQSVSLEWKEKQSGAGSRAYYKYVPFKNIGHTTPSTNYFNTEEALPTNYSLDFNINNEFAEIHYSNTQNKSLIDGSSVFSEQGFYVVYLADEAGNWRYVSFCIDKTEMTIWQYSNNAYQDVQNYNVVSADTKLQWGGYKLINLNLYYNQLESIKDKWIKDVFKEKIEDIEDNDILNSKFDDGKLYFAVEVHSIKYLQEGSAYVQLNGNISYEIKLIQTIDGTELAVEMTYVFYFIDESNPYFKSASTLSTADFANRASKNFRITTSSDASKADIILNESNVGPTDFTNIAYNSSNLSQSGFTDSYSYNSIYETYSDKIDTRSKYYYATGSTASKNISLLTYIFITNPSDSIIVEKVTVYYYAFVTIGKQYKLSDTAEETVIYDINESIDHTENIENGDFLGFQAYNVNVEYDSVSNSYRSKEGKYVIVRSYTQDSTVDKYDFLIRESVFMVDRQDIVSSPTYVDDELLSVIGQFIHIFVLDGELDKRVKFDDIYMAYNNDGFILETNKLPVISYTPISKYGNGTDDLFNIFDVLQYFYTMTSDSENVYLKRFKVGDIDEKSILGISYFGSGTFLTNNFNIPSNLQKIKNSSFDLTVRIDYAVESNYERALIYNGTTAGLNGYFTSPEFKNEGYYFVTMTQNYANGNIFPNVRNTFSFNFCITKLKPQFDFLDSDGEILKNAPSAINTYYTNENSARVSWNDNKSPYMAKINMTADGRGYTTGIYYYTNNNPTRRYIKVDDIVTNGLNHYFDLDISSFNTSTIIYVYMEYEGRIQNDSSHITKTLYIDRQAPTKVLNTLIASTSVGGISVGGYSRLYVDEANEPTETDRRYNIPTSTGALAFYTFAVELTEQNLNSLFRSQPTVSGYFTEGYYYYALEIGSSSSLFVTNIASAKNAYASHTVDIFINQIKAGKIYEIIESDLAGNITIYSIYFVKPNTNQIVLDFEKPATDLDKSTNILYGELNQNQNIFAKSYFKMKEISLYNYEWLVINVNSKTYLTTPYIDENHFYDITNWVDLNTPPNIYSLDNIMSFTSSRNVQTLILVEPCKNFNYIFNISITDEQLTYNALVGQEGIRINGFSYQGGISVNLSSISIYSWKSSIYELIYDYENIFYSTNYITYIHETNYKVFSINQPETAYKYVFADNYGISYVFYHTIGEPEIEDKIVGEVDTVLIPDIDGEGMTTWSVGLGQVNYYYSNVDYSVFIKMEYLTYNATTKTFSWTTFNAGGVTSEYGSQVSDGIVTNYYSCLALTEQKSINQIKLKEQLSTLNLNSFDGTALKYVITLINNKENPSVAFDIENVIQEHIIINNLNPKIELFDKNNENKNGLFDGFSLFSGQLTIRFNNLTYNNPVIFPTQITMQFENESETVIYSGTNVSSPGTYKIRTYITIGGTYYLYKTKNFVISESSSEFFKVMVFNTETDAWEVKNNTGKSFEYDGVFYSSHYIVNTKNYRISTNEEQDIEFFELPYIYNSGGTETKFYRISNHGSPSTLINYYQKNIAITYVKTESLLTSNSFYYTSADGQDERLTGISSQIVITTANQEFSSISIVYNSYYGIRENMIDVIVYFGENELVEYYPLKSILSNHLNIITLTEAGNYTIRFRDQAGNIHKFSDESSSSLSYQILYINGVMFLINENQPIENGVYNDEIKITLPPHMDSYYDAGGKPVITVFRNGDDYTESVGKNIDGEYIINKPGYYTVYFSAIINSYDVRNQSYSFTIIDSDEARWAFEFSEFANYEITSVKKNDKEIDLSKYFKYNTHSIKNGGITSTVKYLRNIYISLFDEVTGAGNYEVTIRTNIGIAQQKFTFNFIIKDTNYVPIKVSIPEGTATANPIVVSFNAYDLYNELGKCIVVWEGGSSMQMNSGNSILIDKNYIESLSDYNITKEISKTGTAFVQVVTTSGKVLYSYKVIKEEPLSAISIILIVASVLAVVALTVTVTLLRRRMKVR